MAGWSNRTYTCPFYRTHGRYYVNCEGGKLTFPNRITMNKFINKYCAHHRQWQCCTLASAINEFYEDKDYEKETKKKTT